MSRHLDRLFTQAFTGEEAKAAPGPRRPEAVPPAAVEEEAADPSEPGRILAAHKRKDYAACLGLPPVTLDALGRPEWPVTDRRAPQRYSTARFKRSLLLSAAWRSRVLFAHARTASSSPSSPPCSALSRAFRQRSLRVHPDKNPAPEARLAFDALNAAQRHLLDHNNRVSGQRAGVARAAILALLRLTLARLALLCVQMEYVREEGERQLQQLTSDQPVRGRGCP
jgi:hypothetical protein